MALFMWSRQQHLTASVEETRRPLNYNRITIFGGCYSCSSTSTIPAGFQFQQWFPCWFPWLKRTLQTPLQSHWHVDQKPKAWLNPVPDFCQQGLIENNNFTQWSWGPHLDLQYLGQSYHLVRKALTNPQIPAQSAQQPNPLAHIRFAWQSLGLRVWQRKDKLCRLTLLLW